MRISSPVLLLTVILLGCSDPLSPEDVSGVYELTVFRGVAVPATIVDASHSYEVSSGELYLLANGMSRHIQTVSVDDQTEMISDYMLAYELHGNEIRWVPPQCPPGTDCGTSPLPARLRVVGNRLVSSPDAGEQYARRGDL